MSVSHETLSAAAGRPVSRETLSRLNIFVDLLFRWNDRINLLGQRDMADIWRRHIADSLQLAQFFPSHADRGIDLGTGAGFPGLILSLATNTFFELIEADQRKAAFLMEAIRLTNAKAVVHARRIEETTIHPASLITSRALAPLSNLLELTLPLLTASGAALFLKGRKVEDEIEQASSSWTMVIERYTSVTDPGGTILKISGLVRA